MEVWKMIFRFNWIIFQFYPLISGFYHTTETDMAPENGWLED